MKNFIAACVILAVFLSLAVLSHIGVNRFTDKARALIQEGDYSGLKSLYNNRKEFLKFILCGEDLRQFEQAVDGLLLGIPGSKEKALGLCEEFSARERVSFG